jgi:Flp pilus assembly protein TadG
MLRHARPRLSWRALARSRSGATAVEFAIIGAPFLGLLFTILELGMMFMASTSLDAAAEGAARLIRTGQLQQGADNTAAGFKAQVCNNIAWISASDCNANLSVNVATYQSFSAMNATPPVSGGAIDQTKLGFSAGNSCDIELVQVYYPYTLVTPLLEPGLPNLGSGQRLLTATVAFRNENWAGQGAACT